MVRHGEGSLAKSEENHHHQPSTPTQPQPTPSLAHIEPQEVPQAVLADRLHRRIELSKPGQARLQRLVVLLRAVDQRRRATPSQRAGPPVLCGRGAGRAVLRGVRGLEVRAGVDPGGGGHWRAVRSIWSWWG
jgi:hypothetical protein